MSDLKEVLLKNKRLIYKIASYFSWYQDKEDLFQAGFKGMIDAYNKFDSTKGVKFTTFAYDYILGEMRKLVRENKILKVSRDIDNLRNKIEKIKEILIQKYMKEPTTKELANYLEIPEYHVIEALNSNITSKSLDENVGYNNMLMHEVINNQNIDRDTLLFLKTELEKLNEPEKTIMMKRYYEDMTQSQIAKSLGLSQVDVSRKESKVLVLLKEKAK